MAKKLGEIMIERRLITPAQLEEALQAQLVTGNRIGSALVQNGAANLDDVGRCLSIQHGVPHMESEILENISPPFIKVVSEELVFKYAVIPFKLEGSTTLHLAMRDPLRQIAGELSFALKRSIMRYVVPELRVVYLMEKYYDIPRDPRFLRAPSDTQVTDERRTCMHPTVQAEIGPDVPEETDKWAEAMGLVFLDQYEDKGNGPDTDEVPVVFVDGEPVKATSMIDVVLGKLQAADTGETIARLLVEPVLENTASSVLFWVRGHHAVGCSSSSPNVNVNLQQLQRLVVPLDSPSLLQWAFQMRSVVRGDAEKDTLQLKIAAFLGMDQPGQVCVAPVLLGPKVVNLLCIMSPHGSQFPDSALQDLKLLTDAGAAAYQGLVSRVKQGG